MFHHASLIAARIPRSSLRRPLVLMVTAVLLAQLAGALPARAADEHNTVPGLTASGAPLGLHGADPVTLLRDGRPVVGSAEHNATHEGVAYYFVDEANRAAFAREPQRFVPQNGGFCTFGVSVGKKFDGDPRYAAVEGGRLYVFLNEEIFSAFEKDRAGVIAKAKSNWNRIRSRAAVDL